MVSKLSLKLCPAAITPGLTLGLCSTERGLRWAGGGRVGAGGRGDSSGSGGTLDKEDAHHREASVGATALPSLLAR